MTSWPYNVWLHRLALLTALSTLGLLCVGGLVTSHGYGLAVPDWPNTYGYNMFFFPFSQWVGGVFYEHSHRLAGSWVGFLTLLLALALHGERAVPVLRWGSVALLLLGLGAHGVGLRQADWGMVVAASGAGGLLASLFWPRGAAAPLWLRRVGLAALLSVVVQGVLGGLRVVLLQDTIGILHAALAQLFFALTCVMALWTSRWWRVPPDAGPWAVRWWVLAGTVAVFVQLVLGAGMRHRHAGLAVPDFPLAYGRVWPATDADALSRYNQARPEVRAVNPITAYDVKLHMAHRLNGVGVLALLVLVSRQARRRLGAHRQFARAATAWAGLAWVQLGLGAATVWTGTSADIATLHVAVGALLLAWGGLLTTVAFRPSSARSLARWFPVSAPSPAGAAGMGLGGAG